VALLLALGLLAAALIGRWSKRTPTNAALDKQARKEYSRIPGPFTKGLPLLGNLLDMLHHDFHCLLLDWADEYGGIYR
jgi:hypothetical protein